VRLLDRIMLTLVMFVMVGFSAFAIILALGLDFPLQFLGQALHDVNNRMALGVSAAIILLVSLRFVYYGFVRPRPEKRIRHETEFGSITVAHRAIDNLVTRTIKRVAGVREVKTRIDNTEAGLAVALKVVVSPDASIPDISREIQQTTSSYIKTVIGTDVASVRVYVSDITDDVKSGRVR